MSDAPRLRPADSSDARACAAIYAPIVRDTPISFELTPPTPDEMRRRIEAAKPLHPWLVCALGDAVLGYAYAAPHRARAAYRWSVDVSIYGHPDHRRRGVGRALYQALLAILALQGYRRACAGITLPNAASVALHEGCGFTPVGVYRRIGWKCGAWHDVGWWERPLQANPVDPPPEPRALPELVVTAVDDALARAASRLREPPGA